MKDVHQWWLRNQPDGCPAWHTGKPPVAETETSRSSLPTEDTSSLAASVIAAAVVELAAAKLHEFKEQHVCWRTGDGCRCAPSPNVHTAEQPNAHHGRSPSVCCIMVSGNSPPPAATRKATAANAVCYPCTYLASLCCCMVSCRMS
jgi:hypothetical protein